MTDDPYLNQSFDENIIVNKSTVTQNSTTKWNHYHHFYELYFFEGNNMQYFIEDKVYNVERNSVVLVDKLLLHRTLYGKQSKGERTLVMVNPSIFSFLKNSDIQGKIENLFARNKIIQFDNNMTLTYTRSSLDHLLHNNNSPESTWKKEKAILTLTELLLTFLELPSECFEYKKDKVYTPKEKHVYDIINYLTSNYNQTITLEALSQCFYIDKHYLCHIFKEITGMTIVGFLNTKRLSEAERMLLYTDYSITKICQNIGFNSISYFIKLFKQYYNCSPSQFKKNMASK